MLAADKIDDVRSVLHVMFAHHDKFSAKRERENKLKGLRTQAPSTSRQSNNKASNNDNIPIVEIF